MISLNGYYIKPTIFPDKTSQVWKIPEFILDDKLYEVVWSFEGEAELMHLAQLARLLRNRNRTMTLHLPYLPYARQDKLVANDATFALRVFAEIVSCFGFNEISCYDPHSEVASDVFCGLKVIRNCKEVNEALSETGAQILCYPDEGARNKYTEWFTVPYVYGQKVRDQQSGRIERLDLVAEPHDLNGKDILIVDDICDGGATFILLAEALKEAGAAKVHLFVSHGIFSRGISVLRESGIERIFIKEGEIK